MEPKWSQNGKQIKPEIDISIFTLITSEAGLMCGVTAAHFSGAGGAASLVLAHMHDMKMLQKTLVVGSR